MDLFDRLKDLREQGLAEIKEAESEKSLNDVRVKLVGKKGELTQILHQMKDVAPEKRREVGQKVNELRDLFNEKLASAKDNLIEKAIEVRLEAEKIDVTLPGRRKHVGSKHPIRIIQDDLERFFIGMSYQVVQGPEIESEHYNFEMLNLPKDHPARDMQATFYVDADHLLRSQTSPVQARTMEKHDFDKGDLKMISPGKVYRRDDDDATHSHQFMQMEGLVVGKNISLSDLKGTLELVAKHEFGQDRETRLRPSYFPLLNHQLKWTFPALNAAARAARSARTPAGSKFWVPGSFIRMFCLPLALTQASTPALPLAWAWTASPS